MHCLQTSDNKLFHFSPILPLRYYILENICTGDYNYKLNIKINTWYTRTLQYELPPYIIYTYMHINIKTRKTTRCMMWSGMEWF